MQLRVVSDLHMEFNGHYDFEPDSTYLIPGDIAPITTLMQYLKEIPSNVKIIFIAGNHEFYNHNIDGGYDTLRNFAEENENLTFLQDNFITLEGDQGKLNIYGTTLWTDLKSTQFPQDYLCGYGSQRMNDFRTIRTKLGIFTPMDSVRLHNKSKELLETFLLEHSGEKNIVMTHHLPSFQSVSKEFEGSTLNYFFASSLDDFILKHKPEVWIHGHTHDLKDYFIGNTRILCNPVGYPNENNDFRETSLNV
jgi:predicted phosphodiesterase